jgi:hypothetical protein
MSAWQCRVIPYDPRGSVPDRGQLWQHYGDMITLWHSTAIGIALRGALRYYERRSL